MLLLRSDATMPIATDISRFADYTRIADALIARADKEELAECARILALAVAQYALRFGEFPLSEYVAMLERQDPIDADTAKALAAGMEQLVGVLGTVIQREQEASAPH